MNKFGEAWFPGGRVGAHNPMLGFVPENGVVFDIAVPGSDSGGSQGQIQALAAFGQFIGCFLDFFGNRSIPLHQQSEKQHQQDGAPNPSHERKIGQGLRRPVAKMPVDIPGDRQVCSGTYGPGGHRVQRVGFGLADNIALGPGAARLPEAPLNLKLQSIQFVEVEYPPGNGIVIDQTDDNQRAVGILNGQRCRRIAGPLRTGKWWAQDDLVRLVKSDLDGFEDHRIFAQRSVRRQWPQGVIGVFDRPFAAVRPRAGDGLGVEEKGGRTGLQGIRGTQKFNLGHLARIFEKDRQAGQGSIALIQPPQNGCRKPPGGLGGFLLPDLSGIAAEFFTQRVGSDDASHGQKNQ